MMRRDARSTVYHHGGVVDLLRRARSSQYRRAAPTPGGAPVEPLPHTATTLTARAQRLRPLRGAARWRVTGTLSAGACTGRVQIVLARRERTLKRVTAPLRKCRFSAVIATTSRSRERWLQVRTVRSATLPALHSRPIRLGR